jgi:hypothetical protein
VAARELLLEGRVVVAIALQGVQLISAMVLGEVLLGAAYAYSDGAVASGADLALLGPSGQVGLALIGLITLLSIASTFVLATHEELRTRVWIAPVVGIAASVLTCGLAIAGFQPIA